MADPQDRLCLNGESARAVDIYLYPQLNKLRQNFRAAGDPTIAFLAGIPFLNLRDVKGCSDSFQFSQLLAFLAEMLLAEGRDANRLELGIELLNQASEILSKVPVFSAEVLKAHTLYSLHKAIMTKALGRVDDAINAIRKDRTTLIKAQEATGVDLVMLDRQEAILLQDSKKFSKLLEAAYRYKLVLPLEYYATLKRAFEFAINCKLILDAQRLYPEFVSAFRNVRSYAPPLLHVAFAKNVGQYWLLNNDTSRSNRTLGLALLHAKRLELRGQERHISAIMDGSSARYAAGLRV